MDLLLLNRELDYGFDEREGVALIRRLRTAYPNVKTMLVSNYPDAQQAAVQAGALARVRQARTGVTAHPGTHPPAARGASRGSARVNPRVEGLQERGQGRIAPKATRRRPYRCSVTPTCRQYSSTGHVEHFGSLPVQTCLPNGTSSG